MDISYDIPQLPNGRFAKGAGNAAIRKLRAIKSTIRPAQAFMCIRGGYIGYVIQSSSMEQTLVWPTHITITTRLVLVMKTFCASGKCCRRSALHDQSETHPPPNWEGSMVLFGKHHPNSSAANMSEIKNKSASAWASIHAASQVFVMKTCRYITLNIGP